MDKMEKDELDSGYSLDDFGLNFDAEDSGTPSESHDVTNKINALDLEKLRETHSDSHSLQGESSDAHDYAPQFQGFDFSKEAYSEFSIEQSGESSVDSTNFSVETNAQSRPSVFSDEREMLLHPQKLHKQSEIGALFVAYAILFFILLLFMPQVYLANNIYYASKNINDLKSQREALRDENGDLQQKLESLKFNFLTLEIEEIK